MTSLILIVNINFGGFNIGRLRINCQSANINSPPIFYLVWYSMIPFILSELRQLSEKQKVPVDLDTYIKKLAISRRRILLVNDILQNVQVLITNINYFQNVCNSCKCKLTTSK